MLSLLTGPILQAITGNLFDKVADTFQAYFNKQISREEAQAKVSLALASAFAEVEKSHADSIARTFASFMDAAKTSLLLRIGWFLVVTTQLSVLIWHQVGIPAYVHIVGGSYPSSGTTVEWAYLLLAACLGMGAVLLRSGPGVGNLADRLKSLVVR